MTRAVAGLVKGESRQCFCEGVWVCQTLQLVHQSINELNKIQSMASIKLLHVSALGRCLLQGVS